MVKCRHTYNLFQIHIFIHFRLKSCQYQNLLAEAIVAVLQGEHYISLNMILMILNFGNGQEEFLLNSKHSD